jgi:hypothetical protein
VSQSQQHSDTLPQKEKRKKKRRYNKIKMQPQNTYVSRQYYGSPSE